jgi:hypothetical protein
MESIQWGFFARFLLGVIPYMDQNKDSFYAQRKHGHYEREL